MADVKLTKTELRDQQHRLSQLKKYLPTLQLKKALLQVEVLEAANEIEQLQAEMESIEREIEEYCSLLSDRGGYDLFNAVKVKEVKLAYENVAGIDVPILEKVIFERASYGLFDTPHWLESAIEGVRCLLIAKEKIRAAKEKKRLLQKELREVSIRVNLFEKILIPRALQNIKRIRIFLGDQQLAAVCQAKVAKQKIVLRSAEQEAAL